jgi:hypothetical protein
MSSSLPILISYITSHFLKECFNTNHATPFNSLNATLQDKILAALYKTKNTPLLNNHKILYYNRCVFNSESSPLDGILFCDNALVSFDNLNPFQKRRVVNYSDIVSTTPVYTNIHAAYQQLPEVIVRLKNGSIVRLSVEKDYSIYELDGLLLNIRNLITRGELLPRFFTFNDFLFFYQYRLKRNPIILHPADFNTKRFEQFKSNFSIPFSEQLFNFIELVPSSFESGILFTDIALYLKLPKHPFMRIPYDQIIGCNYNGDRHHRLTVLLGPHFQYCIEPLATIFENKIEAEHRYLAEMFTDIAQHPSLFIPSKQTTLAK